MADEDRNPDSGNPLDDLPNDPVTLLPPTQSFGRAGSPPLIFVPTTSTALEEDDPKSVVPAAALWAMKYRRHFHLSLGHRDDERLRAKLGEDVFVIDDGDNHVMITRLVGTDRNGLQYFLVGRVSYASYDHVANDGVDVAEIFTEARDLALCSVFEAEDAVSNVNVVDTYPRLSAVPPEYRTGTPAQRFAVDQDGTE